MRKNICLLVAGLVITGLSLPAVKAFSSGEGGFVQSFDNGAIDWSDGLIQAKGIGLPPPDAKSPAEARLAAGRAAKVVAYRNLAELVYGVRVNSETTVENYTTTDSTINTRVNGFIKGARETEIKHYEDGAVEVTIEAALNGEGGLANIVLPGLSEPKVVKVDEPLVPGGAAPVVKPVADLEPKAETGAAPAAIDEAGPAPGAAQPPGEEREIVYTGLVLDTAGLEIQPALSPKILTEENEEIYGVGLADPRYRSEIGLVEYRSDLELAKQDRRVTLVPLVVKGIAVSGKNRSDVVIKTGDAKRFQSLLESRNIVERCRVIFVLK